MNPHAGPIESVLWLGPPNLGALDSKAEQTDNARERAGVTWTGGLRHAVTTHDTTVFSALNDRGMLAART